MSLLASITTLLPRELHSVIATCDPEVFNVLSRINHDWNYTLAPVAKNYRISLVTCATSCGTQHYYLNGKYHREDGPAIIRADGTLEYYLYGIIHREDGPAIIWPDGTVHYYLNGQLHREDGPAIIWPSGAQWYYLNGVRQPQA